MATATRQTSHRALIGRSMMTKMTSSGLSHRHRKKSRRKLHVKHLSNRASALPSVSQIQSDAKKKTPVVPPLRLPLPLHSLHHHHLLLLLLLLLHSLHRCVYDDDSCLLHRDGLLPKIFRFPILDHLLLLGWWTTRLDHSLTHTELGPRTRLAISDRIVREKRTICHDGRSCVSVLVGRPLTDSLAHRDKARLSYLNLLFRCIWMNRAGVPCMH